MVAGTVRVLKHEQGKAFYGNLAKCGSVWVCPVCAAKITERRKDELREGFRRWQEQGGKIAFLTLTFPHYRGESLAMLLARFRRARHAFRYAKGFRAVKGRAGIAGTVTGLEVTWGENGWHPHTHEAVFYRGEEPPTKEELLPLWQAACRKAGLPEPSEEHGLTIGDGTMAADYVGKWGAEHELTKAHVKRGKEGGKTPWDLLEEAADGAGKTEAGALFVEYATVFKGTRQLSWSKGMRQLLDLGKEKTDEEIAEKEESEAEEIAVLTRDEWKTILANDLRGEVLAAAEEGGAEAVFDLLLRLKPPGIPDA